MTPKTDLLIQYALLIAAEADDAFSRRLGPIHLIKYVYLADLAFAARNDGETYTGTRWIFHNFGPWSNDVNKRIEPAADGIEAGKKLYPGKASAKEATRFETTPNQDRAGRLENLIPADVAAALRRAVKMYGSDTKTLLRDVYLTPPMLNAAPGEDLDFSTVAKSKATEDAVPASATRLGAASPEASSGRFFSVNQRKRIAAEADRRLKASIAQRTAALSAPAEPRYDEIFQAGIRWLDQLAGEPMPESESGELHFAEGVWKDPARTDSGT